MLTELEREERRKAWLVSYDDRRSYRNVIEDEDIEDLRREGMDAGDAAALNDRLALQTDREVDRVMRERKKK